MLENQRACVAAVPAALPRRSFLQALAASAAAARLGAQQRSGETPARPDALVMDAMGELRPEYDAALIRAMLASGMDSITVTLCDPKPEGAEALELALDSLLQHDRYLADNPGFFLKATSAADVERARREGKLAVFYLYQNTVQFARELDRVDLFRRLGLSSCQLTYNTRNHAGAGCWEEGGLTPFGRELVERMNARRMLIDLSHANMQTMADTIAASKAPVIVSHTACMAVHANRRNTTDANLRALAARGGVVGICQMRPFLTIKKTDNLDAYFDHILHAIRVAGVEHVCIGSDRDHRVIRLSPEYIAELKREEGSQVAESELPYFIDELNGPRRMEVVWDGLAKRGLGSGDVERVMGGNLLRLYRDVIGSGAGRRAVLTLLVMAAGLGSRYGGLKQLDPVGPAGETVLDYSVFDALRAGFGRVVFVIRREIEVAFRASTSRYESRVPFACVFQELEGLPAGPSVAPQRSKPWGTAQAVLSAAQALRSPFVVVNADDFYGARPYVALADFLRDVNPESREHALVPYRLGDTLSPHGPVARGLCEASGGWLARIEELTAIETTSGGIAARTPKGLRPLQREALASMNVWGFTPSVFGPLDRQFRAFLAARGSDPAAELSLPEAVNAMVAAGEARVRVLEPAETWFGVTYRADAASFSERIRALVERGDYPSPLWGPA